EHNLLDQNFYHGIYASSESKTNILGNVILGSSASYYIGIYLEYCHGANRIEGNDIRCISADNILRLETCHGTPGTRPRIMNNFFSSNGTAGSNAFMINNCKRYDVFNNNISLLSTSPSTALYFHTDSSLHLANNIIVNNGAGQILYGINQTAFVSDYNNYYGTGSFGIWNNASVADLDSWKMATTQDANSMDVNPQYMSETDLHVSNILLNGVGQSLAAVTIDIDGDVRAPMPDIGADEFDPSIANDAGVFMYLGPNAPFAHGLQPVTIALKNYGYETMTSADIRWLVNGIEQPVYHWTGSLGSALCDTVVIGNFTFAEYSDHDFILWSELPNGVPDSTHINDTLSIDDQYPALSGTYTVGGVLPDFNIFIQLENALNKGGILNNVTFDIRPGTYNTQLIIQDFPRTSYTHQVIFQSEDRDSSLVNIRRNFSHANNYTIKLSDAHNIIFRDLTLSSTQGRIVDIADASSKIDINHCRLTGVDIPYVSGGHQLIYSSTTTEDSVYISSNRFEEGDYGIYLTASGGDLEKDVSITDNYFRNVRYRSIHTHNHDGLTINGNTIFNDQHDHEGISITAS
ncbi:MAG TPA: right-handed parallel beta-helix repeat-containing protein, partial [Saprospiraceae bacterium]|nr:right-handed parallel beta-helix repeat-containing protein [Saprospiraceae bacterium]